MLRATQLTHTLDGQKIRGDARNLSTHAVEHLAELLQVGFARGIVNGGCTLGQNGGHDDISRTRY